MTLPDKPIPGKPSRVGLYAPFVALALGVAAWTGVWLWMRSEVFAQMDAAASALAAEGYRVDWSDREVSGYPFRLDLDLDSPRVREPSGWGLAATRLKAEAFVFAPDHWVVVAPDGVTLTRRVGGPVRIAARVLRASLSDTGARPPRISVEALGLTLSALPGAAPPSLTSAAELHIHTRAGPKDQGAAYVEIDGAHLAGHSLPAEAAAGRPATLVGDAIFSHASALTGSGFADALRSWSAAGGALMIRRLSLDTGDVAAEARSGELAIGSDGRLTGRLDMRLRPALRLLDLVANDAVLPPEARRAAQAVIGARARGAEADAPIEFQAGRTTLGPAAIGPPPRVY